MKQRAVGVRGWVVAFAVGCAALASACENSSGKVTQTGSASSTALSGATNGKPEAWVPDVPVYPGAKVTASTTVGGRHLLLLSTTDTTEQAAAFYKAKLSTLKQLNTISGRQNVLTNYQDANGRQLQLNIGKSPSDPSGNTTISMLVKEAK